MKTLICISIFFILSSCGQSNTKIFVVKSDSISAIDSENNPIYPSENDSNQNKYREQSISGFEKATLFLLSDSIKADFNGDGVNDMAFFIKENETSGIVIQHGTTNEIIRIGFGKDFATWAGFDCNWVDYWGLVEDKETFETTFTEDGDIIGTPKIQLQNPSIVIGEYEVGGGLITFIDGKYMWIHQTC